MAKQAKEKQDDGQAAVGQTDDRLLAQRPSHKADALVSHGGAPNLLATNLSGNPAKMSRLLIQADTRMGDFVGKEMRVVGYLIGHGTIAVDKETGEVASGYWLRVLLDDGKTASTTSPTLIRSFACIAQMFPDGQWASPVPISVVSHDSATNPGKWLECYMVDKNATVS